MTGLDPWTPRLLQQQRTIARLIDLRRGQVSTKMSSRTIFNYAPTGQGMGAEVSGVDLGVSLPELSINELKLKLAEFGVLLVRGQALSESEQLAFIGQFGDLQGHPVPNVAGPAPVDHPDERVFYLTNGLDAGSKTRPTAIDKSAQHKSTPEALPPASSRPVRRRSGWHTDLQYMPEPQVYSMLHSLEIPNEGGDTEWCDMAAAFDALPGETKDRLLKLRGLNQASFLRDQAPAVHPVVRIHPVTGRHCLYVSPALTLGIEGLSEAESDGLIDMLTTHATQPQFCYRHQWRVHDTLIWDNRGTMHTRHRFDLAQRRVVRRTQTVGEPVIAAS